MWATRSLNRPGLYLVDGPYKPEMLEERLVGRVVGVFAPTIGRAGLREASRPPTC